jgi:hypothetical protein
LLALTFLAVLAVGKLAVVSIKETIGWVLFDTNELDTRSVHIIVAVRQRDVLVDVHRYMILDKVRQGSHTRRGQTLRHLRQAVTTLDNVQCCNTQVPTFLSFALHVHSTQLSLDLCCSVVSRMVIIP